MPTNGRARESGSVTLWVVIMTVPLIAAIGLVYDGGLALAAKGQAISDAYGAARAGAEALNVTSVRVSGGPATLDVAAAQQAAVTFLSQAGVPPGQAQIAVTPDEVTVTVNLMSPAPILNIIDVHGFHVTGHGSAKPIRGVIRADG